MQVIDRRIGLEKRHRVTYKVVVRFHEDDEERVGEIVLAAPDDHELVLTDQDDEVIIGRWSCVIAERPYRRLDFVKKPLIEGGLRVTRRLKKIEPGVVYLAPRPTMKRLCRCQNPDARCLAREV